MPLRGQLLGARLCGGESIVEGGLIFSEFRIISAGMHREMDIVMCLS
jgi:hypothetical protein